MGKRVFKLIIIVAFFLAPVRCLTQTIEDHLEVIKSQGENPLQFVQEKLNHHDLLIFDDALHNAKEPFEFYEELLRMKGNKIEYVFIEVFGINNQPYIDAYLENSNKDDKLLLKVFQDDFSGYGWRYETYHKLLSTIWDINHSDSSKIKVKAVDQPIYWEGIHNRKQYDIFLKSLKGRDYFMYKTILELLDSFKQGRKGIFLTNTRHSYKHIKNVKGELYWNSGTFFNQWHPNKTYSIRVHNAFLSIERKRNSAENVTSDGLRSYEYEWIQIQNGIWDQAFKKNGDKQVALPLKNNLFGKTKYVGNHMLNIEESQTMYDAYDALIFLKPIGDLRLSAKIDFIYTNLFIIELKRRLEILNEGRIDEFLQKNKVASISEYIKQISRYQPETKNELIKKIK